MIELEVERYLSEVKPEILDILKKKNVYVVARPGLGKTFLVDDIASDGKRVIMVTPMKSTRDGSTSNLNNLKIVETKDIANGWQDDGESSYVVIWDTFKIMLEKNILKHFDLVVFDEIHNIVHHTFRSVAFSIAKWIVDTSTSFLLMTGTPSQEHTLFPNIEIVKVKAPDSRKLSFNEIDCILDDRFSCLRAVVGTALKHRDPIIYYANRNRKLQDKVVAAQGKDYKVGFYSASTNDLELKNQLEQKESFGDYDIVCATKYLAEGINIYLDSDSKRGVIVVTDEDSLTPMNILQVANRFRDANISVYYIHVQSSKDGKQKTVLPTCLDEIFNNNGLDLTKIDPYSAYKLKSGLTQHMSVKIDGSLLKIDDFNKKIEDISLDNSKMNTPQAFKAYFTALNWDYSFTLYKPESTTIPIQLKNDITDFLAKNLQSCLDIWGTISLENKIYVNDVIREARLQPSKIVDNKIIVSDLCRFKYIFYKCRKLAIDGVPVSTLEKILSNPKKYGEIDEVYALKHLIVENRELFLRYANKTKEDAINLAKVTKMEELKSIISTYPKTTDMLIKGYVKEVSSIFKLADTYSVYPTALEHAFNNIVDINNTIIYNDEFAQFASIQLDLFIQAKDNSLTDARKKAAKKANTKNNAAKKCYIYINGYPCGTFNSKKEAAEWLKKAPSHLPTKKPIEMNDKKITISTTSNENVYGQEILNYYDDIDDYMQPNNVIEFTEDDYIRNEKKLDRYLNTMACGHRETKWGLPF